MTDANASIDTRDEELARLKREHAAMTALLREMWELNRLDGRLVHSDGCMGSRDCACLNRRVSRLLDDVDEP